MRIIIADDHKLIIEGMTALLESQNKDYSISGAINKEELFQLLSKGAYDILFQDVSFGLSDARDFVKNIHVKYPKLKIIIISSLSDIPTVKILLKQGSSGYILKSDPQEEILKAMETVLDGAEYISKNLRKILESDTAENEEKVMELSIREKQILSEVLKGKTTRQISESLFLSPKTIETYRSNLLFKFDVTNLASLVRKAIYEGYT